MPVKRAGEEGSTGSSTWCSGRTRRRSARACAGPDLLEAEEGLHLVRGPAHGPHHSLRAGDVGIGSEVEQVALAMHEPPEQAIEQSPAPGSACSAICFARSRKRSGTRSSAVSVPAGGGTRTGRAARRRPARRRRAAVPRRRRGCGWLPASRRSRWRGRGGCQAWAGRRLSCGGATSLRKAGLSSRRGWWSG